MTNQTKMEDILKNPERQDLQDLFEKSLYDPDPDKRKVYNALYTYVLDKRQEELLKQPGFNI
ncbi:hypothetical protein [Levilactobacillus bambusae]|uniref:Uncharacterized protein n=1 Tax=Levilactobacillus bambusae TaxID=2024736 RepID=A0A2V1N082_9LACO|nr:hypothetical protein [Levilactobacillus bambusae]PWG00472.1 hypothetical protein DCM90_05980 [Levilactobacillus bambusae]